MSKPKLASTRPRAPVAEAPLRAFTVQQVEDLHPGVKGRLRQYIFRAGAGHPDYAWLKPAILRVGRTVLIDEPLFAAGLRQRSGKSPAPDRRGGSRDGGEA